MANQTPRKLFGRAGWIPPGLAFAFLAFLIHASLYGTYLVDDAGISFAYSKNLAAGHGLVPQPGKPPVEGYSNPTWVLLFAALEAVGLNPLPLAPKVVGLLLGFLCLFTAVELGRRLEREEFPGEESRSRAGEWAAILLAMQPCFVFWCLAGLENPLTAFLALGFVAALARTATGEGSVLASAGIGLGLALTRPDGILYPIVGWLYLRARRPDLGARYLRLGLIGLGLFFLHRWWTFSRFFPLTFTAKGPGLGLSLVRTLTLSHQALDRLGGLAHAWMGTLLGVWVFLGLLFLLARTGARTPTRQALRLLTATSLLIYFLLPRDWMLNFRFATAFFPLATLFLAHEVEAAVRRAKPMHPSRVGFLVLAGLFLVAAADYRLRVVHGLKNASMPLERVRQKHGVRFTRYQEILGVERASVLLVDVGAPLYDDDFEVVDAAGLTTPEIAEVMHQDVALRRTVILEKLKPDILCLGAAWAAEYQLSQSETFARDYEKIAHSPSLVGFPDVPEDRGVFVRKELLDPVKLRVLAAYEAERMAALESQPEPQIPALAGLIFLAPGPLLGWIDARPEVTERVGKRAYAADPHLLENPDL